MGNDYIPRPNAQFHVRRNNFANYVNAPPADLALAAGDVVDLNNTDAQGQAGRCAGGRDLGPGNVGVSPAKLRPAGDSVPSRLAAPESAKLRRTEHSGSSLSPSTLA